MMHVVSVLAENKHGVLLRVAGVLCARGVNIERLAACPTTMPGVSRITMAFEARDEEMANIIRRIDRLVNVIRTAEVRSRQRRLETVHAPADGHGELVRGATAGSGNQVRSRTLSRARKRASGWV